MQDVGYRVPTMHLIVGVSKAGRFCTGLNWMVFNLLHVLAEELTWNK